MSNSFTYVPIIIFIITSFHPDIKPLRDPLKIFCFYRCNTNSVGLCQQYACDTCTLIPLIHPKLLPKNLHSCYLLLNYLFPDFYALHTTTIYGWLYRVRNAYDIMIKNTKIFYRIFNGFEFSLQI